MLNIFDLLLSLMQTDNYVYFLLPIDICAVFFYEHSRQYQSSVCSYKDTLQLLSGKQFVIVIFIFAFRSTLKLLVRQTGKIECYCLNVSIVFNHFIFLVCLLFFIFFERRSTADFFLFFFQSFELKAARFKRPYAVPSCLKIKIWHFLSPITFYTDIPIDKEKQANKRIVIIYITSGRLESTYIWQLISRASSLEFDPLSATWRGNHQKQ